MRIRSVSQLIGLGVLAACASNSQRSEQDRTYAQTHFEVAIGFWQEGHFPEALAEFQKAHNLNPEEPDYLMHRGMAYLRLERFDLAEADVAQACTMRKPYPECWNNLAYVQLARKNAPAAAISARKALETDTYTAPELALGNLANAQIEMKQYAEAKATIDHALRLSPNNCDVRFLLSRLAIRQNDYDLALSESKRTVFFCRLNPTAHLWEAYSFYKIGQRARAERKYRDIMDLFRKSEAVDASRTALEKLNKRIPLDEPK
ncbi:MAG: tetratricopeptide repeat protein [Bdellovibrionales bacterium]|nr:tetratricopeptide repeat protein [Bdellovibrionales bacterium]